MQKDASVIYVGRKAPMDYVLRIITSFSGPTTNEVTLKARGQAITTAVDAVEIARNRFVKELKVGKIILGTEEMAQEDGRTRAVSTIEIPILKEVTSSEKPKRAQDAETNKE